MLAGMGAVILLLRPLNAILSRTFSNLGLMPQLTFSVRWQSYRYVLRQSLAFFQNDFAGRIAQKVLQTGPALRDTVSGIIDGIWTLLIYVGGTIYLFVELDARLIVPIALWTIAYAATIVFLVPPVRGRSAALSEANSLLSGRIVDGYSNIQSVKLFAHAEREDAFALEGFQRHLEAYRAFSRTTGNLVILLTVINSVLIFSVGGLAVWLWSEAAITVGGIALAISLVIRLNQMSGWILRQITSLFESVGTVQNGMQTISQPYAIAELKDAPALRREPRRDQLREGQFPLRSHRRRDRGLLARHPAGREGRDRRPLRRRQIDARQPAPALLRPRERPHPDRRPGHRAA